MEMTLVHSTDITTVEPDRKTVQELQAAVKHYCLSLTRSGWDAEDLAQDTWLKAISALEGSAHANPEALMLRIAKTTWIDQTRRKHTWARILKKESFAVSPGGEPSLELEEALHAVMKHLSPLQRCVWLLRDVWEYTGKEAAELLQMTEGAVKSALHRARQQLPAIRRELEAGSAAPPELSLLLTALAAAYRTGNIPALLQLLKQAPQESAQGEARETDTGSKQSDTALVVVHQQAQPMHGEGLHTQAAADTRPAEAQQIQAAAGIRPADAVHAQAVVDTRFAEVLYTRAAAEDTHLAEALQAQAATDIRQSDALHTIPYAVPAEAQHTQVAVDTRSAYALPGLDALEAAAGILLPRRHAAPKRLRTSGVFSPHMLLAA
jgi:RNA polymerase sigma factor (sigma-70 family)